MKALATIDSQEANQTFLLPDEHAQIMAGDPRLATYTRGKRGLASLINQFRALRKLSADKKPDVVVFHSTFSLLALALTRTLRLGKAKPRLIYIAHCWASEQYTGAKARLVRAIEGRLCGFADVVVNISHNDLKIAQDNRFWGHHVLVENAVPDVSADVRDDLFASEPEALHLLFIGRFDRQKGLDILMEALPRVQERRPDLKLHVIGGAVRAGRAPDFPPGVDHVKWVAHDEVDQWYRSADALVLASRWEGLPLVIPEALRNGTPVVVSQRSGMETLFEEGKEGFSYPLSVEALAERLATLDRTQLRAMRPACRALYESRYSMSRLHAEILRAYRGEAMDLSVPSGQRTLN
jgi:glycosyltransferase involved in cell wall biosynthesis